MTNVATHTLSPQNVRISKLRICARMGLLEGVYGHVLRLRLGVLLVSSNLTNWPYS